MYPQKKKKNETIDLIKILINTTIVIMKITIFIKLRIHFSLYKILQRDQKTTTATINQSIKL